MASSAKQFSHTLSDFNEPLLGEVDIGVDEIEVSLVAAFVSVGAENWTTSLTSFLQAAQTSLPSPAFIFSRIHIVQKMCLHGVSLQEGKVVVSATASISRSLMLTLNLLGSPHRRRSRPTLNPFASSPGRPNFSFCPDLQLT